MEMVQVVFQRPSPSPSVGTREMVVWVEKSWGLEYGDVVSFKGETEKWRVERVYGNTVMHTAELDKKWGLDLPKSQRTER